MQIINLTPHDINVYLSDGAIRTYPKSEIVTRVIYQVTEVGDIDGYPVVTQTYQGIEGLPEPQENVLYLVSMETRLAGQKYLNRKDLLSPDTSPKNAVKDERGNIIGTKQFVI